MNNCLMWGGKKVTDQLPGTATKPTHQASVAVVMMKDAQGFTPPQAVPHEESKAYTEISLGARIHKSS